MLHKSTSLTYEPTSELLDLSATSCSQIENFRQVTQERRRQGGRESVKNFEFVFMFGVGITVAGAEDEQLDQPGRGSCTSVGLAGWLCRLMFGNVFLGAGVGYGRYSGIS